MAVTRAGPGRRSRHEGLRALVWGTRKWGCAVTAPSPRLAVNGTEKWQALRFRFKALLACLCTEGTPAAGKGRQTLLEREADLEVGLCAGGMQPICSLFVGCTNKGSALPFPTGFVSCRGWGGPRGARAGQGSAPGAPA